MKKELSDMYFLGRKYIFCDKYGLYRLKDKRIKCKQCNKKYSLLKLKKLKIELLGKITIWIILAFNGIFLNEEIFK